MPTTSSRASYVDAPVGCCPASRKSNAYPSSDGRLVVIAANADPVFARLAGAMGRPELITDPRFADHRSRGVHRAALDDEIVAWTATLTAAELGAVLREHAVPVDPESGEHTDEVLGTLASLPQPDLTRLRDLGVIG